MMCIQNPANLRIIDIRHIEVPNLWFRRVQAELVHVAILFRMVAPPSMPDACVPHVDRATRAGGPDLADNMLISTDLTCSDISKMRSWYQECPTHLVGRVDGKERQLNVEVVLTEVDYRVLMRIRAPSCMCSYQVSGVVII